MSAKRENTACLVAGNTVALALCLKQRRGIALLITLIFLLLAIVGAGAMQSSVLQEHLAVQRAILASPSRAPRSACAPAKRC